MLLKIILIFRYIIEFLDYSILNKEEKLLYSKLKNAFKDLTV